MKNFRALKIAVGALVTFATAAGAFLQGCGGDSASTAPLDSGGPDVTIDNTAPPPNEAGEPTDAGPDAASEAGPDGGLDAGFDGSLAIGDYAPASALATCTTYADCCPFDGGLHFDTARCVRDNTTYGFDYTLPGTLSVYDAGHVTYNPTAAASCVHQIAGLPNAQCIASGPAVAAATRTCLSVTQGTIPIGQGPCQSPFECVPGANCAFLADGGTCVPLGEAGAPCDPFLYNDTDCSYLGSGDTGLYCQPALDGGPGGNCAPTIADNQTCSDNQDPFACKSLGCGDLDTCGTDETWVSQTFCDFYATDAGPPVDAGPDAGPDAGDGGI